MYDEFGYLPPETSKLPEEFMLCEDYSVASEFAAFPPEISNTENKSSVAIEKRKKESVVEKNKHKAIMLKMISGVLIAGNLAGFSVMEKNQSDTGVTKVEEICEVCHGEDITCETCGGTGYATIEEMIDGDD